MKFEIFMDRPIKLEVEAESYEQAVEAIKRQFKLDDMSNAIFSQPIEIGVQEENVK